MKFGVNALFNASGGSFTNLQILIEEWTTKNIFKDHQCFLFVGASTYEKLKNIILRMKKLRLKLGLKSDVIMNKTLMKDSVVTH